MGDATGLELWLVASQSLARLSVLDSLKRATFFGSVIRLQRHQVPHAQRCPGSRHVGLARWACRMSQDAWGNDQPK